ncbi:DgyrCDS12959 [Dimorphilus gyrociliatus]|uniref:DgyrCDS12959 n=2 Tax=Dimorphilus gyrociliatus TaxID=2664684 RepID=A0A7I8W982_9ANNE|nr:DgyrCDS12959 [Dimorphilus gyrociliatus]
MGHLISSILYILLYSSSVRSFGPGNNFPSGNGNGGNNWGNGNGHSDGSEGTGGTGGTGGYGATGASSGTSGTVGSGVYFPTNTWKKLYYHQLPQFLDCELIVKHVDVDKWKSIHINSRQVFNQPSSTCIPFSFGNVSGKLVTLFIHYESMYWDNNCKNLPTSMAELNATGVVFQALESHKRHIEDLLLSKNFQIPVGYTVSQVEPFFHSDSHSVIVTENSELPFLYSERNLLMDYGNQNFVASAVLDRNQATCVQSYPYNVFNLPKRAWIHTVKICLQATGGSAKVGTNSFATMCTEAPSVLPCLYFNCQKLKRGSYIQASFSIGVKICEIEIFSYNLAYGSKIILSDDTMLNMIHSKSLIADLNTEDEVSSALKLKSCHKVEIVFNRRVSIQSFAARISCKSQECEKIIQIKPTIENDENNFCEEFRMEKMSMNNFFWARFHCGGQSNFVRIKNIIGLIHIDEVEVFGVDGNETINNCNQSSSLNGRMNCKQFALWKVANNSKVSLNQTYNPFSLIDDRFNTCVPFKFLYYYEWKSEFYSKPFTITFTKIVFELVELKRDPILVVIYKNKDKTFSQTIPIKATGIDITSGKSVLYWTTSLSFPPLEVYLRATRIDYGSLCEIILEGEGHQPSLKQLNWKEKVEFKNRITCEDSDVLNDSNWNPQFSNCMSFQYANQEYPWIIFDLESPYVVKKLLISYLKAISSIDISLLNTSRGVEYLDKRKFPYNSQRIICVTKLSLKHFSDEIFCRENAVGSLLTISTFNRLDSLQICEVKIFGEETTFIEHEVLLRTNGTIRNGDRIALDTFSNITAISIRPNRNISEKLIIHLSNNQIIDKDQLHLSDGSLTIDFKELEIGDENNNVLLPISPMNHVRYLHIFGNFTETILLRIFGLFERGSNKIYIPLQIFLIKLKLDIHTYKQTNKFSFSLFIQTCFVE